MIKKVAQIDMTKVDKKQLKGLVHERNKYRKPLLECLSAFNSIPNKRISGEVNSTYELASKIEKALGHVPL